MMDLALEFAEIDSLIRQLRSEVDRDRKSGTDAGEAHVLGELRQRLVEILRKLRPLSTRILDRDLDESLLPTVIDYPAEADRAWDRLADGIEQAGRITAVLRGIAAKRGSTSAKPLESASRRGVVFVSHSSRDGRLARATVDVLEAAFQLHAQSIVCSSVDGNRLRTGAHVEETLRSAVLSAKVFVWLVTPHSVESPYVMFEVGARWGMGKNILPVLACGARSKHLVGFASLLNPINASNHAQLAQFLMDVGSHLDLKPQDDPERYQRQMSAVAQAASRRTGRNR